MHRIALIILLMITILAAAPPQQAQAAPPAAPIQQNVSVGTSCWIGIQFDEVAPGVFQLDWTQGWTGEPQTQIRFEDWAAANGHAVQPSENKHLAFFDLNGLYFAGEGPVALRNLWNTTLRYWPTVTSWLGFSQTETGLWFVEKHPDYQSQGNDAAPWIAICASDPAITPTPTQTNTPIVSATPTASITPTASMTPTPTITPTTQADCTPIFYDDSNHSWTRGSFTALYSRTDTLYDYSTNPYDFVSQFDWTGGDSYILQSWRGQADNLTMQYCDECTSHGGNVSMSLSPGHWQRYRTYGNRASSIPDWTSYRVSNGPGGASGATDVGTEACAWSGVNGITISAVLTETMLFPQYSYADIYVQAHQNPLSFACDNAITDNANHIPGYEVYNDSDQLLGSGSCIGDVIEVSHHTNTYTVGTYLRFRLRTSNVWTKDSLIDFRVIQTAPTPTPTGSPSASATRTPTRTPTDGPTRTPTSTPLVQPTLGLDTTPTPMNECVAFEGALYNDGSVYSYFPSAQSRTHPVFNEVVKIIWTKFPDDADIHVYPVRAGNGGAYYQNYLFLDSSASVIIHPESWIGETFMMYPDGDGEDDTDWHGLICPNSRSTATPTDGPTHTPSTTPTSTPSSTPSTTPTSTRVGATAQATSTSAATSAPAPTLDASAACVPPPSPSAGTIEPVPDLAITLPTLRAIQQISATAQITISDFTYVITTAQGGIETPAAALKTSTAGYSYAGGSTQALSWTAYISPAIGWLSIANPANPGYTSEGGPLWAMAPVLVPLTPLIGVALLVLFSRFWLYLLDWLRKLVEWIFSVIELIPGE